MTGTPHPQGETPARCYAPACWLATFASADAARASIATADADALRSSALVRIGPMEGRAYPMLAAEVESLQLVPCLAPVHGSFRVELLMIDWTARKYSRMRVAADVGMRRLRHDRAVKRRKGTPHVASIFVHWRVAELPASTVWSLIDGQQGAAA